MKAKSTRAKVFALLERGITDAHEIAKRTGLTVRRVCQYRWRWRNPERARAQQTAYHRRKGVRPMEEYSQERHAQSAKRMRAIKPLLDKGLSRSAIAAKLGTTKNAVVGLVWREERRA